jgi:hypothetical protein
MRTNKEGFLIARLSTWLLAVGVVVAKWHISPNLGYTDVEASVNLLPALDSEIPAQTTELIQSTWKIFTLACSPLKIERLDPVIFPGRVGSHVHLIVGGDGFGHDMDFAQTQAGTCTSCSVVEDMSNYWTPLLYGRKKNTGHWEPVELKSHAVYYL